MVDSSDRSYAVTVVSIMRGEDAFVEEWIAYHMLVGVERFIIYDDSPTGSLAAKLGHLLPVVTVIPWARELYPGFGGNKQLSAYGDALARVDTDWAAFIDCDEFIVLRDHSCIADLVRQFPEAGAIMLTWHVFGHNGHYDDPPNLITASLTRRQFRAGNQAKSICRINAIQGIKDPHEFHLHPPYRALDANGIPYSSSHYDGKTRRAHINHYYCRSFKNWMSRVDRGDVFYTKENVLSGVAWRFSSEGTLKKFVRMCPMLNEHVDSYLASFCKAIKLQMVRNRAAVQTDSA